MASEIRIATPADLPAIARLERLVDRAAHWSPDDYEAIFTEGAPRRLVLVAANNRALSGFVVARSVGAEWEIENIAVTPSLRRQGIASSLLGELIIRAQAEGAERIWLEVRESNSAACALYQSAEFIPSARRKGYYGDPREDAIGYLLELKAKK
ncbi:MAG: ribosomal protein S18-alanine N-acetyltransferase [Acidobacteria bacterium]|nr:ribosomal protein S18-alanine N-acetyltransferase [Acidobacteriota bacterium]